MWFEAVIQWFGNFQNVLGLAIIATSAVIILATMHLSSKYYEN